jgi:aspartate/methionine/tyrosine aminotransferase
METAKRLEGINEYYFSQKLREIDGMNKAGKNVINLGIGSPDLPPHSSVIEVLHTESAKTDTHAYQNYKGSPVLRKAIAGWYHKWYKVSLDPETEVLPLIGSKEGIMHICMTYLDAGDLALIPDPGYPTYSSAINLAGARSVTYELTKEKNWLPDFELLESSDLSRVKLMFINYPHMPTGQLPGENVFEELVAFANKHNILLVHDNPYSFILNESPMSLMATPGAMEVALELNSLSKSHNMAGWRVGMLVGSKERINEVLKFKSNMDSGMFLPLQLAAATALQLGEEWHNSVNAIYKKRQAKVFELLNLLQCSFNHKQSGMFVWAAVPGDYENGFALSDKVLQEANVFITPGGIFGANGLGYVRVSLCATEEKITEAVERIKSISK